MYNGIDQERNSHTSTKLSKSMANAIFGSATRVKAEGLQVFIQFFVFRMLMQRMKILPDARLCHLKLSVGCRHRMELLHHFFESVEAYGDIGHEYFLFNCKIEKYASNK
jgi:hypothetical protein